VAHFEKLLETSVFEQTRSKYAFFVGSGYHATVRAKLGRSLAVMENERFSIPSSYFMTKNNMLVIHLDEILNRLIEAGIQKYHDELVLSINEKRFAEEVVDSRRVLSMSDLEFYFVIWLGSCFVSFLVFIYEINSLKLREKFMMLLDLLDFLNFLRARMAQYHDTW
jgi:hypothetical protein